MLEIINFSKLNDYTKEQLEQKLSKKTLNSLELILNLSDNFRIINKKNKLLEYQNTNIENYQWILKDFIQEVNIFTEIFVESILDLFENFREILLDEPRLFTHKLIFNEINKSIETYSVKEKYCNYLNNVNILGYKVSKFLRLKDFSLYEEFNKYMLFGFNKDTNCMIDKNGELIKYTIETLFDYKEIQDKRAAIVLNLGKRINMVLKKYKNTLDKDLLSALEYFSYKTNFEHDWYMNSPIYSNNLYDEKIIEKGSHLLFYKDGEEEFNILALDAISVGKNSRKWRYSFICSFDLKFYIKKILIEQYTQKDMFSFMCLYKDFLINYDYINFKNKNDFNQKHKLIKEANLLSEVKSLMYKLDKRLSFYNQMIEDIIKQSNDVLIVTKNIKDWIELLHFPDLTKKYFLNKFNKNNEPTVDEFKIELQVFVEKVKKEELNKILNNQEKKDLYEDILKIQNFFDSSIRNLFNKLYKDEGRDNENSCLDINRFFEKRNNATFHSTLKDSFVIDYRNKESIYISENLNKLLTADEVNDLRNLICKHKYHDYIEIDQDIFNEESVLGIKDIISLLERTNNFDFPVLSKCALKFRKLKRYKALGIYFSFSKQLGLDFRIGLSSYIHEIAHHIDLSIEYNPNRKRIINFLFNYFENRIIKRKEYYLKSEELIARAAEISLLLLFGRYEKFKLKYDEGEITEYTLIKAIEKTFLESKYSEFMGNLDSYKSNEYFDYEDAIMKKDFKYIDYLLVYFKSFWSGKSIDIQDAKRLPSDININFKNNNLFVKNNEYSYKYFYRGLFKEKIEL
ncbi:hypothetical protein ACNSOL_12240 (plasmid) [Aliarcobacter lanthieri]|uniref:hypothetical protein n=1 Tax=Aliarcobacter lanthieri TaxID=1355374 RepID=UPI003AAC16A8